MTSYDKAGDERARRFRDIALPCLDDAYRYARFLMRNPADAEDAVQECYLRALRSFDSWRGPAIKPWLLAILRNVCYGELARRGRQETPVDLADFESRSGSCCGRSRRRCRIPICSIANRVRSSAS